MKQIQKQGRKNQIGALGEQISSVYLEKQGFIIISQNYLKKYGEIDIVARETIQNKEIIHFIEVKTVSYETKRDLQGAVSRGTWRPEENVHRKKLTRLHRTIEAWLSEHQYNGDWQIDIASVRVVPHEKYATIKMLKNIIV
jgi:Holliday junction resolvase-like predicted endonuclease